MNVGDLATPTGKLVMTADEMHRDRQAWLQLRRGRSEVPGFYCLGSSDMSAILGTSYGNTEDSALRGTAVKLWHEKVHGTEQPDNAPMMWGRLNEATVADYWRTKNRSVTEPVGLIGNADQPWHQSSLDRIVVECPLGTGPLRRCALEIKTAGAFGSRRWHREVPDSVLCQICHQLYVSGLDHIHYAVLIGGNDYHQGVIERDKEHALISYITGRADAFRAEYLKPGKEIEPPWPVEGATASLLELDAMRHPERIGVASVSEIGEVMELARIRAVKNYWIAQEKQAKVRVLRLMDGARTMTFEDRAAIEMGPVIKDWVDQERLAEKYPDVWADPEIVEQRKSWTLKVAKELQATYVPEEEEA